MDSSNESIRTVSTPGRKRKLDHLSFEEKVQRKKLKNRVAAQTSRDRKKKQMEEMVVTIEKQRKEIAQWEHRYNQMKAKCDKLERDVRKLKANKQSTTPTAATATVVQQKQELVHSIPEEHKYTRSAFENTNANEDSCVGSMFIKTENGSAASAQPLPKVSMMNTETTEKSASKRPHSQQQQQKSDVKALLKIIMLCLLYKNSSKMSNYSTISKILQKVCSPISEHQWKVTLHRAMSQMPKRRAVNSTSLDHWWKSQCLGPENREWNPPKIEVEAN
jgi:X box-binding protein 1